MMRKLGGDSCPRVTSNFWARGVSSESRESKVQGRTLRATPLGLGFLKGNLRGPDWFLEG